MAINKREQIQWRISVPIFRNPVILKQLSLAIGLPFGLLAFILVLISDNDSDVLYALGLIIVLLLFTWLFIMAVYRGKYDVEFKLDEKGVLCRTQAKQMKKNRIINTLTVVFGLFFGKLTVSGAGILAQSRQVVSIRWNCVRKVTYMPRSRIILLRGGWMEQIALFCTEDNYQQIEQTVKAKIKHT